MGELPSFPSNWMLDTCCRPQATLERRRESYHAAIHTFRRMKRNARSYVLMIQVLRAQMESLDEDHVEIVEGLFRECCAEGKLTQDLVWLVADIMTPEAIQRLFGVSHQCATSFEFLFFFLSKGAQPQIRWNGSPPSALLIENLPSEWSRIGQSQNG